MPIGLHASRSSRHTPHQYLQKNLNASRPSGGRACLPHMGDFVEPPLMPNSKTLIFWGFFQFRLANHQFGLANPTNIANPNPDPPTPADRVVPIHGWGTKKDQKGDKRTKGGGWVVVSLDFHRVRVLGGGSTKSPMYGK